MFIAISKQEMSNWNNTENCKVKTPTQCYSFKDTDACNLHMFKVTVLYHKTTVHDVV